MTLNQVCGTITHIHATDVEVSVKRTAACAGCQAENICHAFTRTTMDFRLPRPDMTLHEGDRVVIAMESSNLVKSCTYAFLVPLAFILLALAVGRAVGMDVPFQAALAVGAFCISLLIVRRLGKTIQGPTIVEVIHED